MSEATDTMTDGGLSLRLAGADDGPRLWEWRNDPEVRAASLSPDPIPLGSHLDWYARALADPMRTVLVAEANGRALGMVRFDRDGDTATVSILLAPEARGQGLSKAVLTLAIDGWAGGASRLRAVVLRRNSASLALFRGLGFRPVQEGETMVLELSDAAMKSRSL